MSGNNKSTDITDTDGREFWKKHFGQDVRFFFIFISFFSLVSCELG